MSQMFGKGYHPHGAVTLHEHSTLSIGGVDVLPTLDGALVVSPDTASWARLNDRELNVFRSLNGRDICDICREWPSMPPASLHAFIATLYRRGLLTIDNHSSTDTRLFECSMSPDEGHLVELLVTERCNLACSYCLAGTSSTMPVMTETTGKRAIDLAFNMSEAKSLTFEFSGGEPLMRFKLIRGLSEYIRSHPEKNNRTTHLTMQTNGTLLTREIVDWIKEYSVHVGVSLDGPSEGHNRSRPFAGGKGSFEAVMRGINLLRQNDIPFGVLIVLSRANVARPGDMVRFLADCHIRSIKINAVAYLGSGRQEWKHVGLTPNEVCQYYREFLFCAIESGFPIREENLATMMTHLLSKRRSTRCMRSDCGAGVTFQAITPEGDIYPCGRSTQSRRLRIANVFDEIASLSEPALSNKTIESISVRRPSTIGKCETCAYRSMCHSGCSVQALETFGSVTAPTPECDLYRAMYPFLMDCLTHDNAMLDYCGQAGYWPEPPSLVDFDFCPPVHCEDTWSTKLPL